MQLKASDAEDSSAAQEGQNKRRGFTSKGMQVWCVKTEYGTQQSLVWCLVTDGS